MGAVLLSVTPTDPLGNFLFPDPLNLNSANLEILGADRGTLLSENKRVMPPGTPAGILAEVKYRLGRRMQL